MNDAMAHVIGLAGIVVSWWVGNGLCSYQAHKNPSNTYVFYWWCMASVIWFFFCAALGFMHFVSLLFLL